MVPFILMLVYFWGLHFEPLVAFSIFDQTKLKNMQTVLLYINNFFWRFTNRIANYPEELTLLHHYNEYFVVYYEYAYLVEKVELWYYY